MSRTTRMIATGKMPILKSTSIYYNTPKAFYDQLNLEFHFDFDPCPSNPIFDGLSCEWGYSNYVNPPYGKDIPSWLIKGCKELIKGKTSTFLLPAYTDVKWFHDLVLPFASEIRFIKGRLHFNDSKNTAPFASMIVVFKP